MRYAYDALGWLTRYWVCYAEHTLYEYNPGSGLLQPFMFTGREYDFGSGLYYYRFRFYNPTLGRFMQTDPIGYYDSMNLYVYCRNNPINFVDPFGNIPSPSPMFPDSPTGEKGKGGLKRAPMNPTRPSEFCVVLGAGVTLGGGMAIAAAPAPPVVVGGLIAVAAGGVLCIVGGVLGLFGW